MSRYTLLLLSFLAISLPVYAQVGGSGGGRGGSVTVQEEDGDPTGTASTLKFPNGTVTNNGSGSFSVAATGSPADATYITQTPNGSLSAEQALSALSTGCLGSTTTTGVVAARTITGTANQISVANGDCSGAPTISIPTDPTLPGTVSATAFTATGASTGIIDINGVTNGKLRLTTADATAQTITVTGAAQTVGATTLTIPDMANTNDTFLFAAKAATLTNKTFDADAGTGNVLTISEVRFYEAAGCNNATAGPVWDLPTSNAAAAACVTGSNTQQGVLDFDDTTDESAQFKIKLPSDWTGAIDVSFRWWAAATTGSVGWCAQLVRVPDAATGDPAFPAQAAGNCVSDAAKGTTLQHNDASKTGVTCTSCAAGDLVYVRISRDADGGAVTDDMTGDARLVGVEIKTRRAM